jgi:hypothetical protein
MELAVVCNKKTIQLTNLTANSTLKQSKSIEISKDLVLILQISRIYGKKGKKNLMCF